MALVHSSKVNGAGGLPIGSYIPMYGNSLLEEGAMLLNGNQVWLRTGTMAFPATDYPDSEVTVIDTVDMVGDPVAFSIYGLPAYKRIR